MRSHHEADRRLGKRKLVNRTAWADPGGILPVIDCLILDIGEEGARLATASRQEFPQVFDLRLDSARVLGKVEVVWRQNNQVGVKFLERA